MRLVVCPVGTMRTKLRFGRNILSFRSALTDLQLCSLPLGLTCEFLITDIPLFFLVALLDRYSYRNFLSFLKMTCIQTEYY